MGLTVARAAHELVVGQLDPSGASANTSRAYQADIFTLAKLLVAATDPANDGASSRELAAAGDGIDAHAAGDLDLESVDVGHLRRAFGAHAADHAPTSTQRAHSAWRRLYQHLVTAGMLEADPMSGVPRVISRATRDATSGSSDGILALPGDPDELRAALIATAGRPADGTDGVPADRWPWPERDAALLAVFLYTAARLEEVCDLTNASLGGDRGQRTLSIIGKGGKRRRVAVHPDLDGHIHHYRTSKPFSAVGSLEGPAPLLIDRRGRALSEKQVRYRVDKTYRRTTIGGRRLSEVRSAGALVHALRHTVATELITKGVPTPAVQNFLGHASQDTTMHYVRRVAADQQPIMDAFTTGSPERP